MNVFVKPATIFNLIGNTPLVRIKKLVKEGDATILAKLEKFNPSGSVKDRPAKYMLEQGERDGKLREGATLIEPSSGNMGISLAMLGAAKGYKVKIVMPQTMSVERRKILEVLGAEVILVGEEEWRDAAISFAKRLLKRTVGSCSINSKTMQTFLRIMKQLAKKSCSKLEERLTRWLRE